MHVSFLRFRPTTLVRKLLALHCFDAVWKRFSTPNLSNTYYVVLWLAYWLISSRNGPDSLLEPPKHRLGSHRAKTKTRSVAVGGDWTMARLQVLANCSTMSLGIKGKFAKTPKELNGLRVLFSPAGAVLYLPRFSILIRCRLDSYIFNVRIVILLSFFCFWTKPFLMYVPSSFGPMKHQNQQHITHISSKLKANNHHHEFQIHWQAQPTSSIEEKQTSLNPKQRNSFSSNSQSDVM